jgi:hypothetical protein
MNERCFAMRRSGRCEALNVEHCKTYATCVFFKPIWKARKDLARANRRLCALPRDTQMYIADKYHEGKMPWRGETE